jgi:amino acid permease
VQRPGSDDSSGSEIIATGLALPPILYAFGCQIQIFDVYSSVSKREGIDRLEDFLFCILSAIIGMTLTFTAVGFFGVMAFPDKDIKGDVLQMLVNKGLLGSVARGGLVFAIGLSAPLIVHPTKLMFSNVYRFLFRGKDNVPEFVSDTGESPEAEDVKYCGRECCNTENVLITLTVVAMSTSLAVSGVDFLYAVSIMGAFIASPLFFILPGVACVKMLAATHAANHLDNETISQFNDNGRALLPAVDGRDSEAGSSRKLSACCRRFSFAISLWLITIGCGTFLLSIYIRFAM